MPSRPETVDMHTQTVDMHPQPSCLCNCRWYLSMKLCMMRRERHIISTVTCQSVFAEIYKYWECTCLVVRDCTSEPVPGPRLKTPNKTSQQTNDQQQAATPNQVRTCHGTLWAIMKGLRMLPKQPQRAGGEAKATAAGRRRWAATGRRPAAA